MYTKNLKHCILFILLNLFMAHSTFSQTNKHTLERGESLEIIAERYHVSIDEIKTCNPDLDLIFTGMEINIPFKNIKESQSLSKNAANKDDNFTDVEQQMDDICEYVEAMDAVQNLFDAKEYKKAQKQIDNIIKQFEGRVDCTDAYYGKALCSYNRNKWKDAIEELTYVINHPDCDKKTRAECEKLLHNARIYRDQQLENRVNFWGGLIMNTAAVGIAYVSAKNKPNISQQTKSNSQYSSFNNNTQKSILQMDATPALQAIAAQTIQEGQAEEEREYQNFRSQFKKADGSEYTKDEWRSIQGAAYMETKDIGSNNTNALNNTNNNTINSNTNSRKICTTCHGTGRMTKDTNPAQFGYDNSYKVKCNECGQYFPKSWGHTHVTCTSCHGKGYYGL